MTVYITLQRPLGEPGSYTKTITTQKCGQFPYEIALRFAGCNLKCGACFAYGYSWADKYLKNRRVKANLSVEKIVDDYKEIKEPSPKRNYNWLRILGGEPLLNDEYINFLFQVIAEISQVSSDLFNNGIIIQTNGIYLGQGNTKTLENHLIELNDLKPEVKIAIEISIKGTNEDEFAFITRSNKHWYKYNLKAYYNLLDLDLPNLRPVIIAGYGISESYLLREGQNPNSMITLLFDEETPTYHPSIWSKEFNELYRDFIEKYKKINPKFGRMPMYGLKDQFNYPWVRPTINKAKEIYGSRLYDAKTSPKNEMVESRFKDILAKFFLVSNQEYYSFLIRD